MKIPTEPQYMPGMLEDLSDETVTHWISEKNLQLSKRRLFEGFEIFDDIDGALIPEREVSYLRLSAAHTYPQHIHYKSDAFFVFISGKGILLSGTRAIPVNADDSIKIPRGMPHGFKLENGTVLTFISIQSPPILNSETREEDFTLV